MPAEHGPSRVNLDGHLRLGDNRINGQVYDGRNIAYVLPVTCSEAEIERIRP